MARQELTVSVRVGKDGLVHCAYYRPDTEELIALRPPTSVLAQLGQDLKFGRQKGLKAAQALLDTGSPTELASRLRSDWGQRLGHLLFELLFPSDKHWRDLLWGMFPREQRERITPVSQPVRLRIWTDVELLLMLPWRLMMWRNQWLLNCGWTFELTQAPRSTGLLELFSPTKILIVAPTYSSRKEQSDIGTQTHINNLIGKLQSLSLQHVAQDFFQIARTRSELSRVLQGMHPELLYYYGHGEILDHQLCLLLNADTPAGGEEPFMVSELLGLLTKGGRKPPRVVFLNGCVTASGGWRSAGSQLAAHVPLVIANRTTVASGQAARTAERWFGSLFEDHVDPAEALHWLDDNQSQWDAHWLTTVIHREYEYSRIAGNPPDYKDVDAYLDLNRDGPRALIVRHIKDLVTDGNRRVEALVAYATPRNLLGDFGTQALRELNNPHEQKRAQVQRIRIKFPFVPEDQFSQLHDVLRKELRLQFKSGPEETLRQSLQRLHRAPAGPIPRVLWLDFGVFGRGMNHHPPPTPLPEWFTFCKNVLAEECPVGLHILTSLSIEADNDQILSTIHEQIEQARVDLSSTVFRCSGLPPLSPVSKGDLNDYLKKAKHGPEGLAGELAGLIFSVTGGEYEAAADWLKKGQRDGWSQIREQLQKQAGIAPSEPLRRKF